MGRRLPRASFDALPWRGQGRRLEADRAALATPQAPAVLATGNGFIGIRGPGGADGESKVYLNGVYERMPIGYHEAAHGYARESDTRLPVADATMPDIRIDGVAVAGWHAAALDMAAGSLVLEGAAGDAVVRLERLVAMDADVVAMRMTVTAGPDGATVTILPRVTAPPTPAVPAGETYDPRIGPAFARSPWEVVSVGEAARADRLRTSGFTVAAAAGPAHRDRAVEANESVAFDLFAGYAAATDGDPAAQAQAALDIAIARGFDAFAADQRAWFDAFWADAAIELPDQPIAELALAHAQFQLIQAVARDGRGSIAAKGQTGEGYEGHVFWDADSYVLPALLTARPAIARAMLAWRISLLDAARENARAMGQARGALFAWRTIGGRECSAFFPAGSAQYHINANVAHALELYLAATGDRSILAEGGAEMLVETARIWLQIGFHDPARDGAFVINRVTGPDEYSAIVDNNLYTNLMAARHLRLAAAEGGDRLEPGEAETMLRAADAMHIVWDAERDIPAQDERFFALDPWPFAETPPGDYPLLLHHHPLAIYRRRVCKQADAVLAAVVARDRFDADVRRRMLDAYEAVTVHDSTLSASAFATAAANVGDAARAWDYWRLALLTDLGNLFANSDHGLHMASLAGSWSAVTHGFAGMRGEAGLSFAPIAMPALGRYAFRTAWRGRRLRVAVGADTVRYTLEAGDPLDFIQRDEPLRLATGESTERPL